MKIKLLIVPVIVAVALACGAWLVLKRAPEQPGQQATDQPFEWVSDITPGSGAASPPGGTSNDGPWNHRVMSATSSDGMTWVKDEKIIADQASVPDAILDNDNNIRIYYIDWYNGHVISVALSHDGINWIYKKTTIQGEVAGSQEQSRQWTQISFSCLMADTGYSTCTTGKFTRRFQTME